jgi:Ca-activated chloride channel family protein
MLLMWLLPSPASPLQEAITPTPIRVETVLVNVPAVVTDGQGKPVPDLTKEDFTLMEDGVPQQISIFASSEDTVNIALLLDTSKSTVPVLGKIRNAARSFVRQMRPADRALVLSFDHDISVVNPLTDDRADLDRNIRAVRPGPYVGTRLRDAVMEVTAKRFQGLSGRKAIVLLSDGQDYGSQTSIAGLLSSVAVSGTLVYSICYTVDMSALSKELFGVALPRRVAGGPWTQRQKEAEVFLRELSELSAGRYMPSEVSDLSKVFGQIVEELRSQYILGYYPATARLDGSVHALAVNVRRPGAAVRARTSYRVMKAR